MFIRVLTRFQALRVELTALENAEKQIQARYEGRYLPSERKNCLERI